MQDFYMLLAFIDCTITFLKTSVYEEVTTKKRKVAWR